MRKFVILIIVLVLLLTGVSGAFYYWRTTERKGNNQEESYSFLDTFGHWKSVEEKEKTREEAFLRFEEEDYEKAADLFEDLLDQKTFFSSDADTDVEDYLAECYYQMGDYEQADKVYDRLIQRDPGKTRNYLLKGSCLEDQDLPQDAVSCYEQGYKESGAPELLLRICRVYIDEKDYDKALEYAEKGAKGDSRQEFLFMKIVIQEEARDYEAAYEAASEYVSLYPEDEKGRKEYVFLSTRIP